MRSSEHTNLQFRNLLKLQPGLICISDSGCVKPKVPLLDLQEFRKVEWLKKSLGKSGRFRTSGSTFWSRTTGSRFGWLADWLIDSLAHCLTHQNQCNSLGCIDILKFDIERTHQNHGNSLGFIDILKLDIERTHQNH